jgi:hypothetical protein
VDLLEASTSTDDGLFEIEMHAIADCKDTCEAAALQWFARRLEFWGCELKRLHRL